MIAEIEVTPIGDGRHMAEPVSEVVRAIARSGLDYQVTAMGTLVEGEPEDVWKLIRECHEKACSESDRVKTQIRIDEDSTRTLGLRRQVERIEEELASVERD